MSETNVKMLHIRTTKPGQIWRQVLWRPICSHKFSFRPALMHTSWGIYLSTFSDLMQISIFPIPAKWGATIPLLGCPLFSWKIQGHARHDFEAILFWCSVKIDKKVSEMCEWSADLFCAARNLPGPPCKIHFQGPKEDQVFLKWDHHQQWGIWDEHIDNHECPPFEVA